MKLEKLYKNFEILLKKFRDHFTNVRLEVNLKSEVNLYELKDLSKNYENIDRSFQTSVPNYPRSLQLWKIEVSI